MALLRQISSRVRSFRHIRSAILHHGRRIASFLEDRVNTRLAEAMRVDFWAYMEAILEVLRLSCDHLLTTENHLLGERGNDTRKRRERDDTTLELNGKMIHFRDAFDANYKPDNLEEFGFPLLSSTVPFEVLRQSDHLVDRLTHPEVKVPDPAIGSGLPVLELAAEIDDLAKKLRGFLDTTDGEGRLAEAAVVDKDRAVSDWDSKLPWAARSLSGLFSMAGEEELAAKILPSPRRPGRIVQVDDEDEEAGNGAEAPAPPDSESPGPEPPAGEGGGSA